MGLLEELKLPEELSNCNQKQLYALSEEIRSLIIKTVAENGGHLSSNLGVVELTVALMAALDANKDKVIWDVGHQSYTYKILTGRKDSFKTIRKYQGLSGFPKRTESPYDIFGTGHAATSLSAALGIAKARDLNKEKFTVVSVIGDASISSGESFEAINNVHSVKGPFVIILNDNEMSISSSVGVLSDHITSLRSNLLYRGLKKKAEKIMMLLPRVGGPLVKSVDKLIRRTKHILINYEKVGVIYEELGLRYLGPLDAANIPLIMGAVLYAKQAREPVLIHVISTKGKGFAPAEKDPTFFHGLGKFDYLTGKPLNQKKIESYTEVFSKTLLALGKKNKKIFAITAAMEDGTGLLAFKKKYPSRFADVGMSEEHAVTFAGGLSVMGYKPVVAIYSTFMQRGFDQIIHDIALQKLPVIFALDRAGLVGEDGPTHHGVFDLAYLRLIPQIIIMAPKDKQEFIAMLEFASQENSAPIAIRYPRAEAKDLGLAKTKPLKLGEAELLLIDPQAKITIIAIGSMVLPAYELIIEKGLPVNLINVRFLKPLDYKNLAAVLKKSKQVITMEEGIKQGGLYSAVAELILEKGLKCSLSGLGLENTCFQNQGTRAELLKENKLDKTALEAKINEYLRKDGD